MRLQSGREGLARCFCWDQTYLVELSMFETPKNYLANVHDTNWLQGVNYDEEAYVAEATRLIVGGRQVSLCRRQTHCVGDAHALRVKRGSTIHQGLYYYADIIRRCSQWHVGYC